MKRFNEKPTGILSRSDLQSFKGKLIYWIFFAVLVVTCIITLVPSIWVILTAFKDTQEIYNSMSFLPKNMSPAHLWERIAYSWDKLKLGPAILNTLILSLGNWIITIVTSGFAGYVLSKLKPKGSGLVFTLIVWTMMMPSQIRMVPNYIGMLHFPFASDYAGGMGISLLDTYWPMWLGAAGGTFNMILFKNAFDALSQSYVEAGKLDGCSNYGVFFRIMFPLAMPTVIYVSIGALSGAWADYFGPLIYFSNRSTVPLSIYRLESSGDVKMNTKFMGYIFASIPPFIIFLIFQKHIIGGVNIGGVKG